MSDEKPYMVQQTHSENCHRWHPDCADQRITDLRAEVARKTSDWTLAEKEVDYLRAEVAACKQSMESYLNSEDFKSYTIATLTRERDALEDERDALREQLTELKNKALVAWGECRCIDVCWPNQARALVDEFAASLLALPAEVKP